MINYIKTFIQLSRTHKQKVIRICRCKHDDPSFQRVSINVSLVKHISLNHANTLVWTQKNSMMAVSSNVTKHFFEDVVVPEEDIDKFFVGRKL